MNSGASSHSGADESEISLRSVAVVVVNYNGALWIRPCLDSLLADAARAPHSVQVVVVDNDSTDESPEILREFGDRLRVEALGANTGFGSGNNRGVAVSSSDLVLLLNTDVKVPSGLISTLVKEMEDRNLDAVAAREVPYEGGKPDSVRITIDPLGFPAFLTNHVSRPSFYLPAACVMMTRRMYETLGGFDENFFMYVEDVDLFWRARLFGFRFDFARDAVIQHAVHGSSGGVGISLRRFLWRNTNQPMMLVKNYRAQTLVWVAPLYLLSQILEMVGLLLMRQPRAAWTYPQGLYHFVRLLPKIRQERRRVQSARVVPDREILSLMYPGLAKLRSLQVYRTHRSVAE